MNGFWRKNRIKPTNLFGPLWFGDTTSYRLFCTLNKRPQNLTSSWPLLPFIEFTKRGDKRWCHQTDEVQPFQCFRQLWQYDSEIIQFFKIIDRIVKNPRSNNRRLILGITCIINNYLYCIMKCHNSFFAHFCSAATLLVLVFI